MPLKPCVPDEFFLIKVGRWVDEIRRAVCRQQPLSMVDGHNEVVGFQKLLFQLSMPMTIVISSYSKNHLTSHVRVGTWYALPDDARERKPQIASTLQKAGREA